LNQENPRPSAAQKEKDMAIVTIDPTADQLTVFLKHDGKAKVMKYTCSLTDKEGKPAMKPIKGRDKECGPRKLPVPAAVNIGRRLGVNFTYTGKPGMGTRLTFDINQIVNGVSARIDGFDEEVEIPEDGLDSYVMIYEIH
jgi:hypothetical protein